MAFRNLLLVRHTAHSSLCLCLQESSVEQNGQPRRVVKEQTPQAVEVRAGRSRARLPCFSSRAVPSSKPAREQGTGSRSRIWRPLQRGILASTFAKVAFRKPAMLSRLFEPGSIARTPCCIQEQSRLRVDDGVRPFGQLSKSREEA